ncbi:MAG: sodium:proton antiporter [Planctomycetes bacterium]|nr:sodium:proton antiporter [Planctomycetota bacterium]
MTPDWTSLLPALVAIVLAFATRQVLLALAGGIVTGSLVLWSMLPADAADLAAREAAGLPTSANPLTAFLLPAIGSEGFAQILLIYLWSLGGLIGMWSKTGGAAHFARTVGGLVARGPRSSLFFGWLMGTVFHQGGTVSTVLAGTTVKPLTDRHRISHEELSYVVDSTASPVATVIPFNAWPAYVGGIAVGTVAFLPDDGTDAAIERAQQFFFESIVFNFYGVFAVLFTLLFALGWMPLRFPRMTRAIERARRGDGLDDDSAQPLLSAQATHDHDPNYTPSLWDFGAPMLTLLGVAILPYVLVGQNWINEAFCLAVLAAMVVALVRGMSLRTVLDAFVDGCQRMTIGALVLALAVTLGTVAKTLGTADWIQGTIAGDLPAVLLPGMLTAVCMGIAFATGTAWGTYAVMVPIALPLAWAISPDETYVSVCFGAVIGGAVFGDQCSPISDTTILSSMFSGCDLMDHVRTQLPLALSAAGLGIVASTVCAAFV